MGYSPAESENDYGDDDAGFMLPEVTAAVGKAPERALLKMIYKRLNDSKSNGYYQSCWNSYRVAHEENDDLDKIYELLIKLGYKMSEDEKQLQDGTHPLFEADPEPNAETEAK